MLRFGVLTALLVLSAGCQGGDKGGDSAAVDSGSTDGGSTGGTTDGGATDGGTTDGGTTDGGTTDGGSTDGGTTDGETGDTSGADTADFCYDVPAVTYNNFGDGFMTENCQGCHATTAPNRYGAPEEVYFDTVEDCWAQADRILARSTGDAPTMPPQGGVSEDDRTKLEWWLRCAEEGT